MIRANITFRPARRSSGDFTIEARAAGSTKWMEVCRGSSAKTLTFDTAAARDAEIALCRARERNRRRVNAKGRKS